MKRFMHSPIWSSSKLPGAVLHREMRRFGGNLNVTPKSSFVDSCVLILVHIANYYDNFGALIVFRFRRYLLSLGARFFLFGENIVTYS